MQILTKTAVLISMFLFLNGCCQDDGQNGGTLPPVAQDEGEEGDCPRQSENIAGGLWIGKGCTKVAAEQDLEDKLLAACEGELDEKCEGKCLDSDKECILLADYSGSFRCRPARIPSCPNRRGYICYYIGAVNCDCRCF